MMTDEQKGTDAHKGNIFTLFFLLPCGRMREAVKIKGVRSIKQESRNCSYCCRRLLLRKKFFNWNIHRPVLKIRCLHSSEKNEGENSNTIIVNETFVASFRKRIWHFTAIWGKFQRFSDLRFWASADLIIIHIFL